MSSTRTFIAVRLSQEVLRSIEETVGRLRAAPGGDACRWPASDTIHLTLKFLGDVPDERLAEVYAAADRAAHSAQPFAFEIRGLGCFPNANRPRIVWLGVGDPSERLTTLAARLDEELAALGFQRERRPFTPHLTIGRARRGASRDAIAALGRTVSSWPDETLGRVLVERIHVFGSELTPRGAIHTSLHEAPLQAGPAEPRS